MKIDQSGFLGHQKINNGASFCPNVGCPFVNVGIIITNTGWYVIKSSIAY